MKRAKPRLAEVLDRLQEHHGVQKAIERSASLRGTVAATRQGDWEVARSMKERSPEKLLRCFIDKYNPEIGAVAREALAKIRTLLPGALGLVYDNYSALAIGFGPSERASEAILSVALYPRWVSLFFLQGAKLPDPHKMLKGSGRQVRHIVLKDAGDLDKPAIQALIAQALRCAHRPLDPATPGRTIIKSISAKQRPRRPK